MPRVTAPILPGAEPFSHTGGPSGVLVLHGFTGNPQSMRPLAVALAAAGYTVDLPLLPGHGTAVEDMIPTRWAGLVEGGRVGLRQAGGQLRRRWPSWPCPWAGRSPAGWPSTIAEIRGLAVVNPFVDPPAESFRDVHARAARGGHRDRPRGRFRHRQGGGGRARLSGHADRRRA